MFSLSQKSKKRGIVGMIVIMLSVSVFGFNLFRPATTYAQFGVDVNQGLRNVTDNIGDALLAAGLGALVNGASYFMRKIAYDTAKYVVSGDKGQSPLAHQQDFGEYLIGVAGDSAASAIQQFGEPFGLNLCTPPDLRLQIGLQVSISKIYEAEYGGADGMGGPQPRCDWNQFTESWKNSPETAFNDQNLLEKFNMSLKTSQGDIGTALSLMGKVDNIVLSQQNANQLNRLEGEGFKAVTDAISGNIKTPAALIQQEAYTLTGGYKTKLDTEQIAGLYGSGALQILPMALSVFANTLTNTLLQNVLEKGILPSKSGGSALDFYASTINNNRSLAESAFSYLIAGIPQRPLTAYDVVTEYSTCGNNPGLNNCVMDSGLVQAVDRARVDTPLTIEEALEQNLLHPNLPLIPPTREVDNTNLQFCYSSAYCYSNVQKLRKARILPLGFEIAALKSDPDKPWRLGDVVNGFNQCDPSGNPSPAFPYCKLIDPNWIIKAPEARCEALVNGPELLTPNAATRRQECVDFSTCLETDENGQCIGFGYCTKEENTWKMPGSSCREEYNTCKTYTASNGAVASYLSRTLDVQSCSADSVGCRAYSVDQENNRWKDTSVSNLALAFSGRTQALHFNANISSQQCPAGAEGCNLFVDPVTEEKVFLKKAPEYLQCYDANIATQGDIEWPQTQAELTAIADRRAGTCSSFASACIADEVGCNEFRPADGGTAVTGIVGGGACPTQCVGYETFKQESTVFEPAKFPLNFIAREAETCSIQNVGCDEFTNIGAAASGGEALEYYTNLKHCELPQDNNGKVFYSWEGSEVQGYVLKRHTLLQLSSVNEGYIQNLGLSYQSGDDSNSAFPEGSPAYVDDTASALQDNYDRCNQTAYNALLENPYSPDAAHPDCRAFYDSIGGIYYRILRDTVTVSNACTPLRKTNSELFNDTNISNATLCQDKGGLWENNRCNRCMNGGTYEPSTTGVGGSCVYNSIKSEATSCPASANKCRSYIGNTGNNIEEVASFGFEPSGTSVDALNEARAGWVGDLSVEAESLQVGLNSLRVNGPSAGHTFEAGKLQPGAWYELRFWARGSANFGLSSGFAQNNQPIGNAFTFDPLINSNVLAPLTTEWQEYRLGPVQFTGDITQQAQLYFGKQSIGSAGAPARYRTVLTEAAGSPQTVQGFMVTYIGLQYVPPSWNIYIDIPTAANRTAIINAIASVLGISQSAATTIVNTQVVFNGMTLILVKENANAAEYGTITNALNAAGASLVIGNGTSQAAQQAQYRAQIITEVKSITGLNDSAAAAFVDNPPGVIKEGIATIAEADAIKARIQAAGGEASISSETYAGNGDTTALVNEVVEITGLSQAVAQDLVNAVVNGADRDIKGNVLQAEAQSIKNRIENVGGTIRIEQSVAPQDPITVNQFYFLDNVSLVQIGGASSDHIYLIKDSWKTPEGYDVPLACDSTPNDGLPGIYLGCREYTKPDGNKVTVTGFERLCRQEAIGCRALVDTQNTVTGVRPEEKQAYNVVCRKSAVVNDPTQCSVTLTETSSASATYTCTVAKGSRECRVQSPVVIPEGATHTAVAVPAFAGTSGRCISINGSCALDNNDKLFIDGSSTVIREDSDVVYLTHRSEFVCNQQQLGCMKVGLEEQNAVATATSSNKSYRETFVKNDPRAYTDVLCTGDEVGCAAFKQDNNVVYFKDPKVTGNSLCVYKDKLEKNGTTYSGWFLDGVGDGTTPCYPNYLQTGNQYGLWSQGTSAYNGFVGVCDSGSNGCTELVDRSAITSSTPRGKSYFVLLNDRLTQNIGECEGKVGQKDGCILFDRTEDPLKSYNTVASYAKSVGATPPNSLVTPETGGTKDANLILKVDRDRQCHEWLSCKSSITVIGKDGKPQRLCQQYASCSKLGSGGECLSWVEQALPDNTRLTEQKYIQRPTSWTSPEYSGYSLFAAYNPNDYVYLMFPGGTDAYLAYEMSPSFFVRDASGVPNSGTEAQGCRAVDASQNYAKVDGDMCGFDQGGRCYRQRCLYPIKGTFTFGQNTNADPEIRAVENVKGMLTQLEPGICKSYPEPESPFSSRIASNSLEGNEKKGNGSYSEYSRTEFPERKSEYTRANVCQPGSTDRDCSCEYIKVEYKNGTTDYWPAGSTNIPLGICSGGSGEEGKPCSEDNQCGSGGRCNLKERESTSYGQKGLCLEYDLSRPIGLSENGARLHEQFACLTWLPIQVSASSIDLYNTAREAGYLPDKFGDKIYDSNGGGYAYCTESTNRDAGYYNAALTTGASLGTPFASGLPDRNSINSMTLWTGTTYDEVFDLDYLHGDSRYTGIDMGLGRYSTLMQSGTPAEGYRAIQAWAWRNIGESARVLRFDSKSGTKYNSGGYILPAYSEGIKSYTTYSFAPYLGPTSDDSDADSGDKNAGDTGVLMHPPRFSSGDLNNKDGFVSSDYSMRTTASFQSLNEVDITTANTASFAAGGSANQSSSIVAVDRNAEQWLQEDDLQYVHFVPLAFPHGAGGPNPTALRTEIMIPVSDLRGALNSSGNPKLKPVQGSDVLASTPNEDVDEGYNQFISYGEDPQNDRNYLDTVSYALQRTESDLNCSGLGSYCNYQNQGAGGLWAEYSAQAGALVNRNEVYRRYVTIVYNSKPALGPLFNFNFDQPVIDQLIANKDPFSNVECKYQDDNNWFAVGMDFNAHGEFLGYISRWCNGQSDKDTAGLTDTDIERGNGIRFAVIANMQDRCVEYSSVVDMTDIMGDNNKAWTDRVWQLSTYKPPANSLLATIKNNSAVGLNPYGSFAQEDSNSIFVGLRSAAPVYGYSSYQYSVPYQCHGGDGFGTLNGGSNHVFATSNNGCVAPDGQDSLAAQVTTQSNGQGPETLRELFMKYYSIKSFEVANISSVDTRIQDPNEDKSGEVSSRAADTVPPRIFALNPFNCTQQGKNCTVAASDAFTLNGRNFILGGDYDGNGTDEEDKNGNGQVDPIIADSTYTAVVSFFAYADDNRMPIKRVMVNWDDNTPPTNEFTFGLYKNRKQACAATDDYVYTYNSQTNTGLGRCAGTQMTCNSNEDCKFAGTNGQAIACVNPVEDQIAVDPNTLVGACTYEKNGDTSFSGTCQSANDCQQRQNATITCELQSDHLGQCKYVDRVSYTSSNSCQTFNECPDIAGSTRQSCDMTNAVPASYIIAGSSRHFGDAARACMDGYFEFSHTYGCSVTEAETNGVTVGSLAGTEAYDRLRARAGITDATKVCAFTPAVQVLDNWGWCNGTCDDGTGTQRNGCYGVGLFGTGVKYPSGTTYDQCRTGTSSNLNIDPWTYYGKGQGKIIVVPSAE